MEKIKLISLSLALFLLGTVLKAQNVLELASFDQLWGLTQSQNPTLEVYNSNIKKASSDHKAAKSFLLPSLSSNFSLQDNIKLPVTPLDGALFGHPDEMIYAQFGKKYVMNTGLTLNYSPLDWQKIITAQSAKNLVHLQNAQREYYLQTLKNQSAFLYYQSLVALKSLEINREDLKLVDANLKVAQNKYEEGSISLLDLNQAKINLNNVEQNILASQNLYEYNLSQLKNLLGLEVKDSIVFQAELPQAIEQKRYDLQEDKLLPTYNFMVKDAHINIKKEKAAHTIKLSFTGFVGSQQFNDNFGLHFGSDYWFGQQYIGLSLSKPLFTGFARKNKIRAARSELASKQMEAQIAEKQSLVNDSRLLEEFERNALAVQNAFDNYQTYGENLKIQENKLNEGQIAIDVYHDYFDRYLKAESAYLGELSNYYNNLSIILSRIP